MSDFVASANADYGLLKAERDQLLAERHKDKATIRVLLQGLDASWAQANVQIVECAKARAG
jgi:hypothetical protein